LFFREWRHEFHAKATPGLTAHHAFDLRVPWCLELDSHRVAGNHLDARVQSHPALADFADAARYPYDRTAFLDGDRNRQVDGMSLPTAGDGKGGHRSTKNSQQILAPRARQKKVTKVSKPSVTNRENFNRRVPQVRDVLWR